MMDCSVRFVSETTIKDGRTLQVGNLKPALCIRGKQHALAVINDDSWVRTIELDLKDHDKASFVTYHGEQYDPKAFADRFLMSAKAANKPITRRAKHILTHREQCDEDNLPQEILERDLEQERVYAENTPKERQRAAQRPGPVVDKTEEYRDLEEVSDDVQEVKSVVVKVSKDFVDRKRKESLEHARAVKSVKDTRKVLRNAVAVAVAKKEAKAKPNGTGKPATERGTLIKKLAAEFKMDPFDLRVLIRLTGMRAPYDDESKVRVAIKQGQKLAKAQVKGKKK